MALGLLAERELRALLQRATLERLRVSQHARERMEERGVTEEELLQALQRGHPDPGAPVDHEHGSWRYRRRFGALVVVVALIGEAPASTVVVVTVIR